jgi:NAD(P)-dependent dehydrogenase (short-subunit alcohol dehydrogenase family)
VAAAFDAHDKAYGGLDICFANAGIDAGAGFWNPAGHRNPDGQVDTYDPARWDKSIAVNLSGVFYTVSNAVRIMKKEGRANGRTGGSIICTASNAGLVTEPIVGLPYMPAKAGVLHMVRALGLELAEFRIRINAIAPGPFVTNIGGGWLKKDPVARQAWDAIVPLGKLAETDQIKPLALLLASDASDYMTGSHVVIDGGMMLGKYK